MGLKKFRKTRAQDEKDINVSVVCSNYNRAKRKRGNMSPISTVGSHSGHITNPRLAQIDDEEEEEV